MSCILYVQLILTGSLCIMLYFYPIFCIPQGLALLEAYWCMYIKINLAASDHQNTQSNTESELFFQTIMHIMSVLLSGKNYCNCRISCARAPTVGIVFNFSCGRFLQWLHRHVAVRQKEKRPR